MPSLLSYKCLMLFFIPICLGYSCHKQVSSGNSTWKLCVISTHEDKLRFKIKGFFSNFSGSRWLSIGFPEATQEMNYIPFFLLLKPQSPASIVVQQTAAVKKEVNCSIPAKEKLKMISVDCTFEKTMSKYLNSKKLKIFWNTGTTDQVDITKAGEHLIKNHSTSYFYLHQNKNLPDQNSGSTAMRLLRNYGKSMGVIFGISFVLTALITITICCCCKKKTPLGFSKQKLSKDSSVSFYRDDGEADGQSDESDNDEKVAFIRNNNDRNSSV